MSHQREGKLARRKRICYKKKKWGEKRKQPWGKSTDGPWCLCMREGSWWATKQTVGLHHSDAIYTLKSRSHEDFPAFWFLCLEWSKDETGSATRWNKAQTCTRSSPEVRKCRLCLWCFMKKKFFDGRIWIIKALFTRQSSDHFTPLCLNCPLEYKQ